MPKTVEQRWLLSQRPRKLQVLGRKAAFAVVMVVAADGDLATQVQADLAEMVAGASDQVSVLLLVDIPGDDGAMVVEITPTGIRPLAQLPELSTGDPRPLSDFFGRALASYSPKTRFALGFWGHGKGIFADDDPNEVLLPAAILKMALPPRPRRSRRSCSSGGIGAMSMLPDAHGRDVLTNREARSALGAAFARAVRKEPVDMIFSDTCLNGSIEVFTELRQFSRTVVASSLPIPGSGWNYAIWLKLTGTRLPADAREWARLAVGSYGAAYPQGTGQPRAQLAAFSTGEDDLVKAFARVVKALSETRHRADLFTRAANAVQSVVYRENLDLEQLVCRLLELAEEGSPLARACEAFLEVFRAALVGISPAPPGGRELSGLTIWCPSKGDLKGVSRYYRGLEFSKKTKWLKLLREIDEERREGKLD